MGDIIRQTQYTGLLPKCVHFKYAVHYIRLCNEKKGLVHIMKKRIIAMLLCGLLTVSAFTACNKAPVDPADDSVISNAEDSEVAVKIGDYEVTVGHFSSYAETVMYNTLKNSENPDDFKIDDKEFMDTFISDVTENFKQYAAYESYAKSCGVEEPTQEEIDNLANDFVAYYNMYGIDVRKEIGDEFDTLMRVQAIMTKTIEKLAEDVTAEEALATLEDGTYRAKHILIAADENTLSAEEYADKEKLANEVYEKAIAGEDFDALIKEYGEDPGMESNPDGYTFGEGKMVTEFYEGTAALEEGEISKPVKSQFGFHIIQRLPVEATEDMKQDVAYNKMNEDVNTIIDSLEPEYTDAFNAIDFKAMYDRAQAKIEDEKAAAEAEAEANADDSAADTTDVTTDNTDAETPTDGTEGENSDGTAENINVPDESLVEG